MNWWLRLMRRSLASRFTAYVTGVLGLSIAVSATAVAHQKKPRVTEYVAPAFSGPPEGLSNMVVAADLVVSGRFISSQLAEDALIPLPESIVYTRYTLRIGELLHVKGGGAVPGEVPVVRIGGTRELSDRIEQLVVAEFPQFELGRKYILFLSWNSYHGAWTPLWGPFSVYDIEGERVEPITKKGRTASFRGMHVEEFLDALKSVGNWR